MRPLWVLRNIARARKERRGEGREIEGDKGATMDSPKYCMNGARL